jgi:hypothetical protein
MREYLQTFKPVDFGSGARLFGFIFFTSIMAVVFYMGTGWVLPEIHPDVWIFTTDIFQFGVPIILSLLYFLSMDFTVGLGRKYEGRGLRNLAILLPLWILLWLVSFWPIASKLTFNN